MGTLARDVRQALRWLAAHPGFAASAIATLALAVGFSTALFSVVNGVLLRPLPYPHPDELMVVWERGPGPNGIERNAVSPANAYAWRERTRTLAGLAAVFSYRKTLAGGGKEAEELPVQEVTANTFSLLGVAPQLGRSFAPEEGQGAAAPVVMISDGLWHRRFAHDPSVIGRTVDVDGTAATVIGVMPRDFALLNAHAELWLPIALDPTFRGRYLTVIGRLRPGVSVQQARAEFASLAEQLAVDAPQFNAQWGTTIISLREQVVGDVRRTLLVTFAAVLLLLAIAYFNIGNLLLNRAISRRREIGLRLALGATRGRLARQFLIESACIAGLGCVLACGVAIGLRAALLGWLPSGPALPRLADIAIDARVFGFLLAMSLLATVIFGVVPAWAFTGGRIQATIGGTERAATGGRGQRWLRSALVAGEVALALVLLVGAGLLVRTMQRLGRVDLGMRPEDVLTFHVSLPQSRYADERRQRELFSMLLDKLQAVPGVRAAGAVRYLPLTGEQSTSFFSVANAPKPKPGEEPVADIRIIGGQYFETMGIPLRRGRVFGSMDTEHSPQVAIINQTLADRVWPHGDPIGQQLVVPWARTVNGRDVPMDFTLTVVGVVGNDREETLAQAAAPAMYWWYRQYAEPQMSFVARTASDPEAIARTVDAAVDQLDPGLAVADFRTMTSVVRNTLALPRATLAVLGAFAAMALLLATLGLHGVVAYWVSTRVREIGVRVALGAQRRDVLRLVVWQALAPTIVGVIVGLILAAGLTQVMASLLYGVSPTDPVTFLSLAGLLCLAAVLAGGVPGLRAARVDPATALQTE